MVIFLQDTSAKDGVKPGIWKGITKEGKNFLLTLDSTGKEILSIVFDTLPKLGSNFQRTGHYALSDSGIARIGDTLTFYFSDSLVSGFSRIWEMTVKWIQYPQPICYTQGNIRECEYGRADTSYTVYATTFSSLWVIVTFNSQGGSVVATQAVNKGDHATEPTVPTRRGYIFGGWYKEADCTNAWNFADETVAAAVTLYAKWTGPVSYTVTFDPQGGSAVATQKIDYGGLVSVPPDPTRTDYLFGGWYKEAACATAWNFATEIITSPITLYAKWTATEVVTDIDGNTYHTMIIGTQTWLLENLKTTKYNDGTDIPLVTDDSIWPTLSTPGYCWYNNDTANKSTYGALYNWYAVNTGKLAPAGWHVPTDADWDTLQNYLIANGYNYDGTKTGNKIAKSMCTKTDWETSTHAGSPGNNLNTNNSSGFSALPGGCRGGNGSFDDQSGYGLWWSATEGGVAGAWNRQLFYGGENLGRSNNGKSCGFSLRLVKDSK